MAKLRKMLGRADDPQIISLMRMIETQSKRTLAAWAADCAADRYLPIYELACPGDARLRDLIASVRDCLRGDLPMADLRARLREARTVAKDAESSGAAAQAAARAVTTACAVLSTPSNALGFTFYGAAAAAYSIAGEDASGAEYDQLGAAELQKLEDSLKAAMIPDEPDPVKINWNC